MSDSIEAYNQRITKRFNEASRLFGSVVTRNYLTKLSDAAVLSVKDEDFKLPAVRWYRITRIVYDEKVFFVDKFAMLYSALHKVAATIVMVLHKSGNGHVEMYLGARDAAGNDCCSGEILEAGLKGFLPGIGLDDGEPFDLATKYVADDTAVASVSAIASLTDDKKESFIQGVENLVNASAGIPKFTACIIADKISAEEAAVTRQSFENLYDAVAPLQQIQLSFNQSDSQGMSNTITEGFNHSVSTNISRSISRGTSTNYTTSKGTNKNKSTNFNGSVILMSAGFSNSWGTSESESQGGGSNYNETDQNGKGEVTGENKSESESSSQTKTIGRTMQINKSNRRIKSYLDTIDARLKHLEKGEASGLWSVGTYFLSTSNTTSEKLAGIYRGTVVGEKSKLQTVALNLWQKGKEPTKDVLRYLHHFVHPVFMLGPDLTVTAGSVVESSELAVQMSLPQSSIPGIYVSHESAFGRDVRSQTSLTDENSIAIGCVSHLGEVYDDEEVRLLVDGLSKHAFITGTTGSGKSNTLYLILEALLGRGIKFLVIEPAKGEYKKVFGGIEGVRVFCTNPAEGELLAINPFAFSSKIDIYDHIDALVEVFNACWPMYAAMPQVLKHSIIDAYRSCGWDMDLSYNPLGIFPTVSDVLASLREYINSSEYSSDTKGDYKGSLETRMLSLCEGSAGRIFSGAPIDDSVLFDSNVIIDLSTLKSPEVKSLLMGLLILKLDEHRNSTAEQMNRGLWHVTVLEEAHNLLKRTSTAQSAESSNLEGLAVEKIATSMAEMRTYGEGFIIADQSPSMLDLAAMRNTNTKIIMNLPENDDRLAAGHSIGLSDNQIKEISRLKTGEAVVYQNGWHEAIKTRIDRFDDSHAKASEKPEGDLRQRMVKKKIETDREFSRLWDMVYAIYTGVDDVDYKGIAEMLRRLDLSGSAKRVLLEPLEVEDTQPTSDDCARFFYEVAGRDAWRDAQGISDISTFNRALESRLRQLCGLEDSVHMPVFLNMYMRGLDLVTHSTNYEPWLETTTKLL